MKNRGESMSEENVSPTPNVIGRIRKSVKEGKAKIAHRAFATALAVMLSTSGLWAAKSGGGKAKPGGERSAYSTQTHPSISPDLLTPMEKVKNFLNKKGINIEEKMLDNFFVKLAYMAQLHGVSHKDLTSKLFPTIGEILKESGKGSKEVIRLLSDDPNLMGILVMAPKRLLEISEASKDKTPDVLGMIGEVLKENKDFEGAKGEMLSTITTKQLHVILVASIQYIKAMKKSGEKDYANLRYMLEFMMDDPAIMGKAEADPWKVSTYLASIALYAEKSVKETFQMLRKDKLWHKMLMEEPSKMEKIASYAKESTPEVLRVISTNERIRRMFEERSNAIMGIIKASQEYAGDVFQVMDDYRMWPIIVRNPDAFALFGKIVREKVKGDKEGGKNAIDGIGEVLRDSRKIREMFEKYPGTTTTRLTEIWLSAGENAPHAFNILIDKLDGWFVADPLSLSKIARASKELTDVVFELLGNYGLRRENISLFVDICKGARDIYEAGEASGEEVKNIITAVVKVLANEIPYPHFWLTSKKAGKAIVRIALASKDDAENTVKLILNNQGVRELIIKFPEEMAELASHLEGKTVHDALNALSSGTRVKKLFFYHPQLLIKVAQVAKGDTPSSFRAMDDPIVYWIARQNPDFIIHIAEAAKEHTSVALSMLAKIYGKEKRYGRRAVTLEMIERDPWTFIDIVNVIYEYAKEGGEFKESYYQFVRLIYHNYDLWSFFKNYPELFFTMERYVGIEPTYDLYHKIANNQEWWKAFSSDVVLFRKAVEKAKTPKNKTPYYVVTFLLTSPELRETVKKDPERYLTALVDLVKLSIVNPMELTIIWKDKDFLKVFEQDPEVFVEIAKYDGGTTFHYLKGRFFRTLKQKVIEDIRKYGLPLAKATSIIRRTLWKKFYNKRKIDGQLLKRLAKAHVFEIFYITYDEDENGKEKLILDLFLKDPEAFMRVVEKYPEITAVTADIYYQSADTISNYTIRFTKLLKMEMRGEKKGK